MADRSQVRSVHMRWNITWRMEVEVYRGRRWIWLEGVETTLNFTKHLYGNLTSKDYF